MNLIDRDTELTVEYLQKIISKHDSEVRPKLKKLKEYYLSNHAIGNRMLKDPTKPNNKLANPYGNYITDMFVGYFVGEPIGYKSNDDRALEELQMLLTYNDEQDHNAELAKNASIYGRAYELLYYDQDKSLRFKVIESDSVIMIYDRSIEQELLYAIRYFTYYSLEKDDDETLVEVYGRDKVRIYKGHYHNEGLVLVDEYPHFFGQVPVIEYRNNDDMIGDYELIVSLIDAYDKLESDSLNDFEYFCDAYLALYGMEADEEEIKKMKENRVMLLDLNAKAEWLIKNGNDTQIENLKTRIDADIHKFSKCPALTDEQFSSNASGVAMRYKLTGMENVTAIKERKFKRGLQRRIELISNILSIKGTVFDWRAIEIVFTRNLPTNEDELADTINKLRGMVSNETLISLLPFVDDVQKELEKLKSENEINTFTSDDEEVDDELLDEEARTDSEQEL